MPDNSDLPSDVMEELRQIEADLIQIEATLRQELGPLGDLRGKTKPPGKYGELEAEFMARTHAALTDPDVDSDEIYLWFTTELDKLDLSAQERAEMETYLRTTDGH